MKSFNFNVPTVIFFGNGKINELETFLDPTLNRVLLVTDKQVAAKSGALDAVLNQLKGRKVAIFDEVEENPPFYVIKKGKEIATKNHSQLIIGIGGGSSMDAAKGIAVLTTNNMNMKDLLKGDILKSDPIPVICIPTTSGTGSEVTPYAIFTDPENQNKCGYSNPKIFPKYSIVDPELTFSMPRNLIVNTGLDALTHAIESYLSTESFLLNDHLALHAIKTILESLKDASQKNRGAMAQMAYASMIAGITITNAGTILLHVMGYPLTVFHQIPHGKATAILLPRFLEFMNRKSYKKKKLSYLKNIFNKIGGIETFISFFNISTNLSDYGIHKKEIDIFVKKTIVKNDVHITPAEITEQDIADIYNI